MKSISADRRLQDLCRFNVYTRVQLQNHSDSYCASSHSEVYINGHSESVTWEEDKHLVSGIVVVSHEYRKIRPPRTALARLVPELTFKLVQRLIQLVLRHQVSPIVAELQE